MTFQRKKKSPEAIVGLGKNQQRVFNQPRKSQVHSNL
jgi:hypothetical protein